MRHGARRGLVALAAIVLTLGGTAATVSPAVAHSGSQHVWVTLQGNGSTARFSDHEVNPGRLAITFRGSSTSGVAGTVVSLRHGTTLSHFLTELTTVGSMSAPADTVAAAMRDIQRTAVAYGGADTLPGRAVTDAVPLPHRGTYYVVNFAADGTAVNLGRLHVDGHPEWSGGGHARASVTLGAHGQNVIRTYGDLPSRGTIRVHNANEGRTIYLFQMSIVANGVTDAQVQHEYDQVLAGQTPTSDPAGLLTRPTVLVGSDAVSPGLTDRLTYHVPPGTYLLQSFVPDATTGIPQAFTGMHKVVVIR